MAAPLEYEVPERSLRFPAHHTATPEPIPNLAGALIGQTASLLRAEKPAFRCRLKDNRKFHAVTHETACENRASSREPDALRHSAG